MAPFAKILKRLSLPLPGAPRSSSSSAYVPSKHPESEPDVASTVIPLRLKQGVKRDGKAAYARAALRWGIEPSSHLTAVYVKKGQGLYRRTPPHGAAGVDGTGETEVPANDVQQDLEYTITVTIGTPGVTLNLDADTGSSDLWVFSSELSSNLTKKHNVYNPSKSSSAKAVSGASWKISYGDGSSASGDVYKDVVKIGNISIPDQEVEAAKKISQQFEQGQGSDGLIGLAWPTINTVTPTQAKTPMENMIAEGLIAQPVFTVKLDAGDSDGFYAFGKIPNEVGDVTYQAVDNSQGFWMFPSPTYKVGNTSYTLAAGNAAIADTGTTLLLVSDEEVQNYYAAVPGSKMDNAQGGYVFPSSATPPDFTVSVGDAQYTIPGKLVAFADAGSGNTFGGLQSRGTLPFSIFGDVFLKAVYAVFDEGNTRIGFRQR